MGTGELTGFDIKSYVWPKGLPIAENPKIIWPKFFLPLIVFMAMNHCHEVI
jgi:hypothetical protein